VRAGGLEGVPRGRHLHCSWHTGHVSPAPREADSLGQCQPFRAQAFLALAVCRLQRLPCLWTMGMPRGRSFCMSGSGSRGLPQRSA
jgi:hypothetical protein